MVIAPIYYNIEAWGNISAKEMQEIAERNALLAELGM